MEPTTLITFFYKAKADVGYVELFGSWDNFQAAYVMKQDRRRGNDVWTGCFNFAGIVFDGRRLQWDRPRKGTLKQGGRYWYYYRLNLNVETFDKTVEQSTDCPLLPGQTVNVIDIPIEVQPVPKRSLSAGSKSPSSSNSPDVHTLDPKDRYTRPVPRLASRNSARGTSPQTSLRGLSNKASYASLKQRNLTAWLSDCETDHARCNASSTKDLAMLQQPCCHCSGARVARSCAPPAAMQDRVTVDCHTQITQSSLMVGQHIYESIMPMDSQFGPAIEWDAIGDRTEATKSPSLSHGHHYQQHVPSDNERAGRNKDNNQQAIDPSGRQRIFAHRRTRHRMYDIPRTGYGPSPSCDTISPASSAATVSSVDPDAHLYLSEGGEEASSQSSIDLDEDDENDILDAYHSVHCRNDKAMMNSNRYISSHPDDTPTRRRPRHDLVHRDANSDMIDGVNKQHHDVFREPLAETSTITLRPNVDANRSPEEGLHDPVPPPLARRVHLDPASSKRAKRHTKRGSLVDAIVTKLERLNHPTV